MAHKQQKDYCTAIKKRFPLHFSGKQVLDVGSMDINGNNKYLFDGCTYIGLDIGPGPNVDVICPIHEYEPGKQFDTIISTECLEHDKYWKESIQKMYSLLKAEGLLVLTIAGEGRKEHGTTRTQANASPYTNDYYMNITAKHIVEALDLDQLFSYYELSYDSVPHDIRFVGVKRK